MLIFLKSYSKQKICVMFIMKVKDDFHNKKAMQPEMI